MIQEGEAMNALVLQQQAHIEDLRHELQRLHRPAAESSSGLVASSAVLDASFSDGTMLSSAMPESTPGATCMAPYDVQPNKDCCDLQQDANRLIDESPPVAVKLRPDNPEMQFGNV
jgi:hypothetical protein